MNCPNRAVAICEILNLIQVHLRYKIQFPEHLTGLESQYKLVLSFSRAYSMEEAANNFLVFSRDSSNLKKLSQLNIQTIYLYYKERVLYSKKEFKELYESMSNRNDGLSVWLKENYLFTQMIQNINSDHFSASWDAVRRMF
jgi:hypothetical protein